MSKLQIVVFNVGAAQSILIYPVDRKDHAQFIDCGGEEGGFSPVDFVVSNNLLPLGSSGKPRLGGLIVTNYDHDHFSWLPDLWKSAEIWTARFPKNMTGSELVAHKEEMTEALKHLCHIRDSYNSPATDFSPNYVVSSYHLEQSDLEGEINTNHLSQIVFIEFGGSKLCVSGDLEYLI